MDRTSGFFLDFVPSLHTKFGHHQAFSAIIDPAKHFYVVVLFDFLLLAKRYRLCWVAVVFVAAAVVAKVCVTSREKGLPYYLQL